ncbi:hypothetical protein DSECCO2_332300 [anaerobic digester metagenome]
MNIYKLLLKDGMELRDTDEKPLSIIIGFHSGRFTEQIDGFLHVKHGESSLMINKDAILWIELQN